MMKPFAPVAALVMCAACGAVPPSPAPQPTVIQAQRISQLRAVVFDTAFRPLPGATVEIIRGSGTGLSQVTGPEGDAVFSGDFAGIVELRASKDGFVATSRAYNTQSACTSCVALPSLTLNLQSTATTLTLTPGSYDLTIAAGASCTQVPAELRSRTYTANVTRATNEYAGAYHINVPGLLLMQDTFLLGISGSYLATEDGSSPTLFEKVPPDTYLGIDFRFGTSDIEALPGGISVPFTAWFEYCVRTPGAPIGFCDHAPAETLVARGECRADDSRMTLVRR